jgi:hypothetical protein
MIGEDYIELLNRIYLKIEYMRLRENENEKELRDIIQLVSIKDLEFRNRLFERGKNIYVHFL